MTMKSMLIFQKSSFPLQAITHLRVLQLKHGTAAIYSISCFNYLTWKSAANLWKAS